MKIKIITVGKIKEKYLKDAIDEYKKRLTKYCNLEIIELTDEKTKENMTQNEIDIVKNKEGERILSKISDGEYVISLAIEGKLFSSEEIAKNISSLALSSKSKITYIIGGSLGISDEVKKKSNLLMSFGRITLPHQLMRVVLIEQIYRAFRINNNEAYHK